MPKIGKIAQATVLSHNFVIDCRDSALPDDEDQRHFREFRIDQSPPHQEHLTRIAGESPRALVVDNDKPNPGGRPSLTEQQMREEGKTVRNAATLNLASNNLGRPIEKGMVHNDEGNIHMTYQNKFPCHLSSHCC